VRKGTLRTVFLSTFSTAVPLAVLPVWLYRAAIPGIPNWEKVAFCFLYGAVWIALLQPTADVLILKFLRRRRIASAASR
jgi:hypothetical protein